ncbi:MAG: phosphogluconate dehydrogenase (NAD(+)-dependent, decarboxylating) [Terriglobia bacterium]
MQLGFIGLGKMGGNMVQRLLKGGHQVVAFDRNQEVVKALGALGATPSTSVAEMVTQLRPPRIVWLMVPSGNPTQETINEVASHLQKGDSIIDGGNSMFKDSIRRGKELGDRGIHFVDCGTSGGVWGLQNGYCMMIGGELAILKSVEPVFRTLAPENGYAFVGPSGSGHYVKMIHNGIEYGLMQAYGEGFEILHNSPFSLNLPQIAKLWNHASVVRSWLLELAQDALEKDPHLENIKGYVEDSGEGRWTILEAIEHNVAAPVITLSLFERFHSRQPESFSAKVLAALRNEFGGHAVKAATK